MDVPAAEGGERRGKTTLFPRSHGASGRTPESPFRKVQKKSPASSGAFRFRVGDFFWLLTRAVLNLRNAAFIAQTLLSPCISGLPKSQAPMASSLTLSRLVPAPLRCHPPLLCLGRVPLRGDRRWVRTVLYSPQLRQPSLNRETTC